MAKQRKRTNKNVPAKGRLKDIADRLWSLAIRIDWDGKCAVCGGQGTDAHHIIPRQWQRTRYDMRNGMLLCQHDHIWNANISPHQNATGFVLWLEGKHQEIAEWAFNMQDNGDHRRFEGTTDQFYYMDTIRELKQYVEEDDYVRIVGKRFSAYLDEQEANNVQAPH